jgi:hypothetical protein
MLYFRIKEGSEQAKLFAKYALSLPFVEIVDIENNKRKLLSEIEAGLKDVKLMQDGKLKKKTLKQMLSGK